MKKFKCAMALLAGLTAVVPQNVYASGEEMRAVWITTVYNSDFPKTKSNPSAQKEEFISYLDELQGTGINAVMVQVRPTADAFYQSTINPWSSYLTGEQGEYPGYDPMAFMIEETQKRDIEFHAWLNPYRVTTSGVTDVNQLCETHPARNNPSWVIEHNNALYYNPELESVKVHIEETVREIINYYDVDGIHFDDYFYPSNYPLPDGESRDGTVANERRGHINEMVERVSKVVKETNPDVSFGISPMGIWKNDLSDVTGSSTSGSESYYTVYGDTRTWIKEEWIDYVVPQIYWEIGHSAADYATLLKWWANEVSGTDVDLYIGQGIYKEVVAQEITSQLNLNKQYNAVKGSVYFAMSDIINNSQGVKTALTSYYSNVIGSPSSIIQLIINGTKVNPTVDPFLENGTTLVPIRVISEQLGAKVDWDNSTKTVTINKDNHTISLQIGNNQAIVDSQTYALSLEPKIIDDTTMVPIRFISEHLEAHVDWSQEARIITITN